MPPTCKHLDLIEVPFCRLQIEELVARFLNLIKCLESATTQTVLHLSKEAIIRWRSVETVAWVRQDLDFLQFVRFHLCFLGGVGFSVVLLEQSTFATNEGWVLLLQLVIHTVQLLAVEFSVHGTTIRNHLKVKHTQSSTRRKSSPSCRNDIEAELMADLDLAESTASLGCD